jgi:hypothetical protein
MWMLWLVFVISLAGVAVPQALYQKACAMARRGEAGSEYIALAFTELFVLMPTFMLTGTLSALGLALKSGEIVLRVSCSVAAAAFEIWFVLSFILFMRTVLRQRKVNREYRRIMGRDEMIDLIRSSAISSFTNSESGVSVTYLDYRDSDGRYIYKAGRADPDGYQAYVAAANEARRRGVGIAYFNRIGRNGPSSAGTRWVSVDEARELLLSGAVDVFHCRSRDPYPHEPATGEATGIKIIDFGWIRHLYVEPELASTMVPIAQSAAAEGMRMRMETD